MTSLGISMFLWEGEVGERAGGDLLGDTVGLALPPEVWAETAAVVSSAAGGGGGGLTLDASL